MPIPIPIPIDSLYLQGGRAVPPVEGVDAGEEQVQHQATRLEEGA